MMLKSGTSSRRFRQEPQGGDPAHHLVRVGRVQDTVVAVREPAGATAEHLRTVAMRMMVGPDAEAARLFAVVSCDPGDGRSFVAANLAAVFAQSGRRTLLIDADLRSPQQHHLFHCAPSSGLNALIGECSTSQVMQVIDDVPGLHVLTAGERAGADLAALGRDHFSRLLDALRSQFDQIVIDTPAGGHYVDAQAVAAQAGAAVLLVRRNVTRLADANALKDSIRATGANIIGTIFNHR